MTDFWKFLGKKCRFRVKKWPISGRLSGNFWKILGVLPPISGQTVSENAAALEGRRWENNWREMGEKNGLFTYWEGTVTIHGAALAPIVEFLFWGFGAKRLASWGHAAARGDRYYLLWLESAAGIFEGCFHVFITPVSTTKMYPVASWCVFSFVCSSEMRRGGANISYYLAFSSERATWDR